MIKTILILIYFLLSVISIIFVISMLRSVFININFDMKAKRVKFLYFVSVVIVTIFCLDLLLEGDFYPENILNVSDFLSTIDGICFILGIISLVGCGYFLKIIFTISKFDRENLILKLLIMLSLPVSIIFLGILILAGDINPNFTFEDHAKYFTELICDGKFTYIIENKDRIFSESYCKKITNQYLSSFNELNNSDLKFDDFESLEYFFKANEIINPDTATIVLKASSIIGIDKKIKGFESIKQVDYYFNIRLTEIIFNSRFLGKYKRWCIDDFRYSKSVEYSLKEWIDKIQRQLENNRNNF